MNIEILTFAEAPQPIQTESRKGWMDFGNDNAYPYYLLDLYNKSPKHGAILQSKIGYINGQGWKAEDENDLFARQFIQSANPKESLYEVTAKCVADFEIFNGFYLEVHWSTIGGKIAAIYHVDYAKVRTNKDNTQFWYKEDWTKRGDYKDPILAFDVNNRKGKQILYVKGYRPDIDAYAIPNYVSALNYIQSDVEVSKHILGNAKGGFSSSKQVTFVNGEPPEEEAKRIITKRFKDKFTGSEGSKVVVEFVRSADQKTLITDLGQSDLTKEDFTSVNNLIQQEIFAGHRITSPSLFGIKTEGELGNKNELLTAFEIFKNTYVSERQMTIEDVFNYIAQLKDVKTKIQIIGVAPIVSDVLSPELLPYLPKEFIYEKLGIDTSKYNVITDANPNTQALATNDNIKNLTGRQHQNIDRIVRRLQQGKLTKEQAIMMLQSGYGLTPEEANTMLAVDSNFSEDDVISVFAEFGESKSDYFIWQKRNVLSDFVEDELVRMDFEDELSKLELQALGIIENNKYADSEAISAALKIDIDKANTLLQSLEDRDYISTSTNSQGTAERTLTTPLSELTDKKVKTTTLRVMYAYDWRKEVPSSERNTLAHPSRPFCVKLMAMDKLWSRADIEQISARLGYNVFDRLGGYWNNNGTIEYHCRHEWGANVVVKKNNK